MAGLCAPLSTLRQYPREYLRMTRGRCGSLLLHRDGLAPSTPCRSPGALCFAPVSGHRQAVSACPKSANNRHVGFVTKDLLLSCRIKKTLIARCMMDKSRRTRISRFEGHIMRNIASVVGVVAVAAATFLLPAPATAENGQIA